MVEGAMLLITGDPMISKLTGFDDPRAVVTTT